MVVIINLTVSFIDVTVHLGSLSFSIWFFVLLFVVVLLIYNVFALEQPYFLLTLNFYNSFCAILRDFETHIHRSMIITRERIVLPFSFLSLIANWDSVGSHPSSSTLLPKISIDQGLFPNSIERHPRQ